MKNQGTNNQSIIIEDLNTQNADEIKGGTKLPPPTTPISAPPPPRK